MLLVVAEQIGLVLVPILLFFAWKGWSSDLHAELPGWRNGLALSALVLLLVTWLGAAILEIPAAVSQQAPRPQALSEAMLTLSRVLSIIVIGLALALRRSPRIQAVIAGILMLISWPIGYR